MRAALLTVVLLLGGGCYTLDANLPGTLRSDVQPAETESIGKLRIEQTNWYLFWGLVGQPPRDVFAGEVQRQVQAKGGDGVANLTYESENGCVDLLVSTLTGGCIGPRTYRLSGDIVRIRTAPLPGRPAKSVAAPPSSSPSKGTRLAQSY